MNGPILRNAWRQATSGLRSQRAQRVGGTTGGRHSCLPEISELVLDRADRNVCPPGQNPDACARSVRKLLSISHVGQASACLFDLPARQRGRLKPALRPHAWSKTQPIALLPPSLIRDRRINRADRNVCPPGQNPDACAQSVRKLLSISTCRLALIALLAAALCALSGPALAQADKPVIVEPGELTKRPDLVGKEISVEDRVEFFLFHPDKGWDELKLKRCPDVVFAIPPRLRQQHPQTPAARVQGVLRREGDRFVVDVSGLDMMPSDIDRLNHALATVSRMDIDTRSAWVRWAESRARAFGDQALLRRVREVEADVIRAESERPPRDRDASAFFLELADRARQRQVAEPEPSALAHRGFRVALAKANTGVELAALIGRIEAFFPLCKVPPAPGAETELERWNAPYANDPVAAYRAASPAARVGLDHRLWADATQKRLERQAAEDPRAMIALAEQAANLLPDRPDLATSMLVKGAGADAKNISALKKDEVEALARLYSDRLKQPEKARELYRAWLDDQRSHRLSPRDAEGRLALANQYETLLKDPATAVRLLREAWAIDPRSREIADAFRRHGYRKVGDDWVEPSPANEAGPGQARNDPPKNALGLAVEVDGRGGDGASLLGSTPDQVRSHLGGKPNHRSWCASQGQVTEQWVYIGTRSNQYVTFVRKAGDTHPRVISFYSTPHSDMGSPTAP